MPESTNTDNPLTQGSETPDPNTQLKTKVSGSTNTRTDNSATATGQKRTRNGRPDIRDFSNPDELRGTVQFLETTQAETTKTLNILLQKITLLTEKQDTLLTAQQPSKQQRSRPSNLGRPTSNPRRTRQAPPQDLRSKSPQGPESAYPTEEGTGEDEDEDGIDERKVEGGASGEDDPGSDPEDDPYGVSDDDLAEQHATQVRNDTSSNQGTNHKRSEKLHRSDQHKLSDGKELHFSVWETLLEDKFRENWDHFLSGERSKMTHVYEMTIGRANKILTPRYRSKKRSLMFRSASDMIDYLRPWYIQEDELQKKKNAFQDLNQGDDNADDGRRETVEDFKGRFIESAIDVDMDMDDWAFHFWNKIHE